MPLPIVIFADSNRDLRNAMRGQFEQLGFITFLAAHGPEAVEFAAGTLVRLVFLNYHLTPSNGLEACARMRELPGYSTVPILLMAHPNVPRLFENAERAGASAVVLKPFSARSLLRDVAPFLARLGRTAPLPSVADGGPPSGFGEPGPTWDAGPPRHRNANEASLLTKGKLALDVYRQSPGAAWEPGKPDRTRRG